MWMSWREKGTAMPTKMAPMDQAITCFSLCCVINCHRMMAVEAKEVKITSVEVDACPVLTGWCQQTKMLRRTCEDGAAEVE